MSVTSVAPATGGAPGELDLTARPANLWFGQLLKSDHYRWWEVSYVHRSPKGLVSRHSENEPLGVRFLGRYDFANLVAENPRPIAPDFLNEFFQRWIDLFAQTAYPANHRSCFVPISSRDKPYRPSSNSMNHSLKVECR